jgi:hypothetical protein
MNGRVTGDRRPLKRSLTTPCPPPCCLMLLSSRQPGGVNLDEDEKEDPTTGGPREKNWLSKIGAAFGAVGNLSQAAGTAGALGSEEEEASKEKEVLEEKEASEVIKHYQKKMSSVLFDEEAVMPSKQKREDWWPHVDDVSLIGDSGRGSDKEGLVRDDDVCSLLLFLFMHFWLASFNRNQTKNSRTDAAVDERSQSSFLGD